MPQQNPTADYRKYPKGPNFFGIVVAFCVFIIVAFVVIWFILHRDAKQMIPHGPSATPNSLMRPALPATPATLSTDC